MESKVTDITVGSVCSGIEAASVALNGIGFSFKWFSEIEDFPSKLLEDKYPNIPNLGDMQRIPDKLKKALIESPELICGGTPCQAFSLAGWKKGLEDTRGNLTLSFLKIVQENDAIRNEMGLSQSMVIWENVEGVLRDKTNAFGIFLASLAGYETEIKHSKWPKSGVIHGPKRNIAWRVLDAKFFGVPQQRKRLYVLAGGKDFFPEDILFEENLSSKSVNENKALTFEKQGHKIEVFRCYTDCLYSAYGTKWNGNAAAYNGSLFVVQNNRIRRLTPLECERLMGFPDNYTNLTKAKMTNRYKALGNSWAVPVIRWIGLRLKNNNHRAIKINEINSACHSHQIVSDDNKSLFHISVGDIALKEISNINSSEKPNNIKWGNLYDVIDVDAPKKLYISPAGCKGILRRKSERKLTINPRLESVLTKTSKLWSDDMIEKISRKQKRGKPSDTTYTKDKQNDLFKSPA